MQKIEGKKVTLIIPDSILKELDRVSGKSEMPRTELIRFLLDQGLSVQRKFEKLGVGLPDIEKRLKKALKQSLEPTLF